MTERSGSYGPRFPVVAAAAIPWLTVDQMVEADRLAIEDFDIGLLQMMEHAGAGLATLTDRLAPDGTITVLAGGGNNGGGGLCAARHLINKGRAVSVVVATERVGAAPAHHLRTLRAMGMEPTDEPAHSDIVVDAMVGYGLEAALRGRAAELARWIGDSYVVSLDFPSGHGMEGGVVPDATLTLALPKEGLRGLSPLYLADLGLPSALWRRMGLDVGPVFAEGRVVEVVGEPPNESPNNLADDILSAKHRGEAR